MLASEIIDRARVVLNDADGVRWLDSEFFKWINDAQRVIALVRPDSVVSNTTLTLVVGTKQALPTEALRLLDVVRNITPSNTGGRAVRHVDRDVLDTQNPEWHGETSTQTIKNYVYDNRDPKNFYVYPPALSTSKLEVIYSKNPTDVTTLSNALAVADIYADPLLNYVLYRAYSKDAEFAQNAALAASYLGTFNSMLGIKTSKDAAYSPELHSKGRTTSPNAAALQMGSV